MTNIIEVGITPDKVRAKVLYGVLLELDLRCNPLFVHTLLMGKFFYSTNKLVHGFFSW